LPADVPEDAVVVVESGPLYTAVLPLKRTDLGCGAPVRLTEAHGMLALEMYNYQGPPRVHNDLEPMSRFYRGQSQCAFFVETAPRDAYPNGAAFAETVAQGVITEGCGPEVTAYMEKAFRPWRLAYERDGLELGIEIDLMNWTLEHRWTEEGELAYSMLDSPVARQSDSGRVAVGNAALECPAFPAWLYADEDRDLYVAGYHGEPGPFTMITPDARVQIDEMTLGTVVYDHGHVTVDALGNPEPRVVER
jgi:hypothetical protein